MTFKVHFDAGKALYKSKKYDQALIKFQQAVKLSPTHHEAWWYIGQCQCNIKPPNYQAALAAFESAVKVNPKNACNYSGVAHAQKALGNLDAARVAYEKASTLDPKFYQSHYYLANLLLASGQHAKALEYAQKCMALNPLYPEQGWLAKIESINALFNEGVTFYNTKPARDFANALQKFQQVVRLSPTHHEAWWYIGQCQCNIKPPNYQAALAAFESAVKVNPKNACNYSGVAHAQKALGNLDAARVAYEKASALDPKFYQSHYYLANLLLASGQHAKALEYALMCVALAPNYPEQGWLEKVLAANGFQTSSQAAEPIDLQGELSRIARHSGLEIAITAVSIRSKIYDYLNTPTEPGPKKQHDSIDSILNRIIKLAYEQTGKKIPGLKYINFVVDAYKNVEGSDGKTVGEKLICGTVKTTTSYGVTWFITTKLALPPALAAFSITRNPALASGVAGAIAAAVRPIIKQYIADTLAELSEGACHTVFDLVRPQPSKPVPSIPAAKPPASPAKPVAATPKPAATVIQKHSPAPRPSYPTPEELKVIKRPYGRGFIEPTWSNRSHIRSFFATKHATELYIEDTVNKYGVSEAKRIIEARIRYLRRVKEPASKSKLEQTWELCQESRGYSATKRGKPVSSSSVGVCDMHAAMKGIVTAKPPAASDSGKGTASSSITVKPLPPLPGVKNRDQFFKPGPQTVKPASGCPAGTFPVPDYPHHPEKKVCARVFGVMY